MTPRIQTQPSAASVPATVAPSVQISRQRSRFLSDRRSIGQVKPTMSLTSGLLRRG